MKRFGYAMGMQLLALVVYGLAVVDMLFYPDSDLRTIVGMILAARVIEAVAGMIAGSKRSQKFMRTRSRGRFLRRSSARASWRVGPRSAATTTPWKDRSRACAAWSMQLSIASSALRSE